MINERTLSIEELATRHFTVGGYTDLARNRTYNIGCERFGDVPFNTAMNKAEAKLKKRFPQGWKYYPGDVCSHGIYVGGEYDCACPACELGE